MAYFHPLFRSNGGCSVLRFRVFPLTLANRRGVNLARRLVLVQVELFFNLTLTAAQLLEAFFALELRADFFSKLLAALVGIGDVRFQSRRPFLKALDGHFEGTDCAESRVRGKRGRGAGRKIPVIGLLKREGKVFAQIVPNCSKTELLRVIHGQVKGATTIHTDGWKAYDGLVLDGFKHHRVHHHENEFARGKHRANDIAPAGHH